MVTPIPSDITVTITSCARPDLLAETLASLRRHHAVSRLLISEDSGSDEMLAWLAANVPDATVLAGDRTGVMASIDRLHRAVETPYIFHLEDDWAFDGPINFAAARRALDEDPAVSVVCVRVWDELKPKHRARSAALGNDMRVMDPASHHEWYGWTANPGLLRKTFWTRFEPLGRYRHDELSGLAKREGLRVAYVVPGVARHIGQDRHVVDAVPQGRRDVNSPWRRWRKAAKAKLKTLWA